MQILHAGPFQLLYQNGFLRQLKHQNAEVLRMMYFALRDHNWGTFPLQIENETIESRDDSFSIQYTGYNVDANGQPLFSWEVDIAGSSAGVITFEILGTALTSVRKNRAGFCILHPIAGMAQQPVTIFHDNVAVTESHFPRYIAAQDPFLDIRAMEWTTADGSNYRLQFEGDVFQTEDQRNWGDASYKTFCTPLSLPFPVELSAGDRVWQRVTFRHLALSAVPETGTGTAAVAKTHPIRIGIAESLEAETLSDAAVSRLKALPLAHYRVDVYPANAYWITAFSNQCELAAAIGLPLQVVLHLGDHYEEQLLNFVRICQHHRLHLKALLLVSDLALTTPQPVIDLIPLLKCQLPAIGIGVGTDYNFTELNRHRFDAGAADFVCFSFHPQEHAFDDLTLLENTETLLYQVESAEHIYRKPVHISLVSLRKRANPYATRPADFAVPVEHQADPRQKTDFGLVWTQRLLASVAQTKAISVTLFRTAGELGVMSPDGTPYPLYAAMLQG